jgi:hypothetical protein
MLKEEQVKNVEACTHWLISSPGTLKPEERFCVYSFI